MTLKPGKHSDEKKQRDKMKQKERKIETRSQLREELYDVQNEKGSLPDAIRRAERLYCELIDRGCTSPAAMKPATRMFELIRKLEQYM